MNLGAKWRRNGREGSFFPISRPQKVAPEDNSKNLLDQNQKKLETSLQKLSLFKLFGRRGRLQKVIWWRRLKKTNFGSRKRVCEEGKENERTLRYPWKKRVTESEKKISNATNENVSC